MTRSAYEVVVVGAGPAGSVCAAHLAAGGLHVALLDRLAPPRYKTCGGGLVWKARRRFPKDITSVVQRECRAAELRIEGRGIEHRVERDEPIVSMTMRAELDAWLVAQAQLRGAELLAPRTAHHVHRADGGLAVATDLGEIEARWVVAADGVGSRVARSFGWPPIQRVAAALESELAVSSSALERFTAARFDFGLVPGGYAWVFPKREHLSVGCLSTRSPAPPLKALLGRYLDELSIEPHQRDDHGYVIPLAPRPGPLGRNGILLVGDAAGLADPLTGEGISWAIETGELAAQAILESGSGGEDACGAYRLLLDREILPELAIAARLGRLLYGAPGLRDLVLRRAGQPLAEAFVDLFLGRETFQSLTSRPGRWIRLAARLLGFPGTGQVRLR